MINQFRTSIFRGFHPLQRYNTLYDSKNISLYKKNKKILAMHKRKYSTIKNFKVFVLSWRGEQIFSLLARYWNKLRNNVLYTSSFAEKFSKYTKGFHDVIIFGNVVFILDFCTGFGKRNVWFLYVSNSFLYIFKIFQKVCDKVIASIIDDVMTLHCLNVFYFQITLIFSKKQVKINS